MLLFSLEEACKKIHKESQKSVKAISAQSKACGKIGSDLKTDLGDDASTALIEFEMAMNKQAMLAADKVRYSCCVERGVFSCTINVCAVDFFGD